MNPKIILAFLGGAILASGIVYIAARPDVEPKPILVSSVDRPAKDAQPEPEVRAESPAPSEAPVRAERSGPVGVDRPTRAKPSPMLSYTERHEVAQAAPAPAPVPQPPAPPKEEVRQPDPPAPAPVAQEAPAPPPVQTPAPPPPPAQSNSVTLAVGTALNVRVGETLSTKKNKAGDTFLATLAQPLIIDGFVIAERGARAEGRIVEADKAGKVSGVPLLVVELTRVTTSDGQNVKVRTSAYNQEGKSPTTKNAAKVVGGAALGAIIGAVAGGGKGAAIGSGVGGAAGAGDVALTKGPDAEIAVETRLTFKVQEPVTITEKTR